MKKKKNQLKKAAIFHQWMTQRLEYMPRFKIHNAIWATSDRKRTQMSNLLLYELQTQIQYKESQNH